MRALHVFSVMTTAAIVACGSVPDLRFAPIDAAEVDAALDAGADAGTSPGEDAGGADASEPDANACASPGAPCKNNKDCCSKKCLASTACR